MSNIEIRAVEAGDVEAVEALLQQQMEHYGASYEGNMPCHPVNEAVATVNASINPDDVDCGWLAFYNDQPAGIINTPQGLGGGVFVSKEFEGQGIAKALISERESYFQNDLKLSRVERPVRADNEASIGLHKKLGYEFTEASQNLLKENPDPPGHTVLYLEKRF